MQYFVYTIPFIYLFVLNEYYRENKIITQKAVKSILFTGTLIAVFFFILIPNKLNTEMFNNSYVYFLNVKDNKIIFINRWLIFSAITISLLNHRFKCKSLNLLNMIYVPFVVIINLAFIKYNLLSFFGLSEFINSIKSPESFLYLLILSIILLSSIISIIDFFKTNDKKYSIKTIIKSMSILVVTMLISIPNIGYYLLFRDIQGFEPLKHIKYIYIFINILLLIGIYIYMKNKSDDEKGIILTMMSISLFLKVFDDVSFESFLNLSTWPISIYHLSSVLLLFALLFKNKRLFYQVYFLTIFTTVFKMIIPIVENETLINPRVFKYWDNTFYFFIIPNLALLTKYFIKPSKKDVRNAIGIFTIYFILLLCFNIFFQTVDNKIFLKTGENVDYFYLTKDLLAERLYLFKIVKNRFSYNLTIFNKQVKIYYMYYLFNYLFFILLTLTLIFVQDYLKHTFKTYKEIIFKYIKRKVIKKDSNILRHIKKQLKKINDENIKKRKEIKKQYKNASKQELKNVLKEYKKIKLFDYLAKIKEDTCASIQIKDFYKKYENASNYSLKNINLEIKSGEIVGLIGHNGAGKSTLIKTLIGINSIECGSVRICDYDILTNTEICKFLTGYVPDNHPLYDNLTGYEFIKYISKLYNVKSNDFNKRLEYYLDIFNFKKGINDYFKTYSHGMKQKISVIASLIYQPKIWILDEPLTGLDPSSVLMVKKCIKQYSKQGNIVIFSSHIIEIVEDICDRVVLIKSGEIMENIEKSEAVLKYKNLTNLYKKYI